MGRSKFATALISAVVLLLLIAATQTGAVVTPQYTPEQVKALAEAPADNSGATLKVTKIDPSKVEGGPASPNDLCWHLDTAWHTWGHWPAEQKVGEMRDWCASYVGGPQTRRVSHVFGGSGGWGSLCSWSNLYGILVDGGNGWTWATVRSGGHFYCKPWNFDDWMEIACNTWGNCAWGNHNGPVGKPA